MITLRARVHYIGLKASFDALAFDDSFKQIDLIQEVANEDPENKEAQRYVMKSCWKKVKAYQLLTVLKESEEILLKAKNIAEKIHDGSHETMDYARAIKMFGFLYIKFNLDDKADEYLNQAKAIYEKLGLNDNDKKIINIYKNLGKVQMNRRDFDKAKELFEKALNLKIKLLGENNLYLEPNYSSFIDLYIQIKEEKELAKASEILDTLDRINKTVMKDQDEYMLNSISIILNLYRAKIEASLSNKDACVKYYTQVRREIEELDGTKQSPLLFPILQSMTTDYNDLDLKEESKGSNEELRDIAALVFGEDSIFYIGYCFDYYASMLQEDFTKSYQKISKLLPNLKEKISDDALIILLIESYIAFNKIIAKLDIQKGYDELLKVEKKMKLQLPDDHIYFEIVLLGKAQYQMTNQSTIEQAGHTYEKVVAIEKRAYGNNSMSTYESTAATIAIFQGIGQNKKVTHYCNDFYRMGEFLKKYESSDFFEVMLMGLSSAIQLEEEDVIQDLLTKTINSWKKCNGLGGDKEKETMVIRSLATFILMA